MSGIWGKTAGFIRAGGQACLVTLLEVRGSSPREAGARMVIRADGRFSGTIGGGALEWRALAEAQKLMRKAPEGAGRLLRQVLGPDLGQCCGGRVMLLIEAFSTADLGWIAPLAGLEASRPVHTRGWRDQRGVFCRAIASDAATAGSALLVDGVLEECFGVMPTSLLLFGAGHVGRALVLVLAPLPVTTRWIDPRRGEFPDVFPANATPVAADDPVSEIANAPVGSVLLAVTHSHALDLALVAAGLRNPAIAQIGVIGSATKRARFVSQLVRAGFDPREAGRMHCPIGIGALASKEPAVIALGIAIQIMAWREAMAVRSLGADAPITRNPAVHSNV